jgi:tetratricopeptide (TPR) repeat protein
MGMEPLGTITMCFPYVDENTKETLELLMNEAENYADFAEKLCDRVSSESSSPVMEYLAFSFAYWIENFNLIDRLEAAGKVSDLAKPLFLYVKVERGANISWNEVKTSLVNALDVAPNDWIASHLYLAWRMSADHYFSEADVEVWSLETISAAVKENSELQYFEAYLLWITVKNLQRENKRKEAIALIKQVLAIARKFDDGVFIAHIFVVLASLTKYTDLRLAIDMLITARELFEELGYKGQIGYIHHHMGHIMGMRGELDAAIEYQYEFKANQESLGISAPIVNSFIALYYNLSGNGEKALDSSEKVFTQEDAPHRFLPYARAQQAWALINLGRYAEAKAAIAICQELAFKYSDITNMIWYYILEGLLDKAESQFENAQMNFQKVLDYIKDNPTQLFQNICLLNLTEMEIDKLTDTALNENNDSSGHWMKKLEEHVQENDLPGVAAQSMIFKAKLRYRQGKYDDVRRILKEVQDIAKTPSMKYLNEIIISKFPDMIVK